MEENIFNFEIPPIYQMDLEEFARYREAEGAKIIRSNDFIIEEFFKGFFKPISFLKPLPFEVKSNFPKLKLGYYFRLNDENINNKNGSIPVHLLTSPKEFSLEKLNSGNRKKIRKANKLFDITVVEDPKELFANGFNIYSSAMARTSRELDLTATQFETKYSRYFAKGRSLLLAARPKDAKGDSSKICGFMLGFAIENKGYIDQVYVHSDYTNSNINRLLLVSMIQAYAQVDEIKEVTMGQHFREKPGIASFKEKMMFPAVQIPAYNSINFLVAMALKKKAPHKYYRITGEK